MMTFTGYLGFFKFTQIAVGTLIGLNWKRDDLMFLVMRSARDLMISCGVMSGVSAR